MVKFGLVGGVLGHSLSALIHNKLFEIKKAEGEYTHYETADLNKTFYDVLSHLDGFNITLPYKKDIMKYLTLKDETAELYDACNFVVKNENGYHGYNTDADGFLYAMESKNVALCGKKALVTGAGGVSYMLATASAKEGADVTVLARNEEKAANLCRFVYEKTGKRIKVFEKFEDYDILLQGTPAGMYPIFFDSPLPLFKLKNIPYVFETIYNPVKNLTASVCEYYGNTVVSGLEMLVGQAVKAHEIFFGYKFEREDISEVTKLCYPHLKNITPDFNIILIGAPGCGKSTTGKELSVLTGGVLCDIDREIEIKENMSVSDIFASKGEEYFRAKETEVLRESLSGSGKIISTGGGIIERNDILKMKNEKDIVIYLDTPVNVLESRLKNDISRPLLAENAVEKLHSLLKKRENIYKNQCDIKIVPKEDKKDTAVSVIDEIIKKINNC